MTMIPPPEGAGFAYEESRRTLDEQMRWIDTLDTKAGVLLAAAGLIAGLILGADSPLTGAPKWVVATASLLLLASLVLSLLAFATRRYEVAPNVESIVAEMSNGGTDYLMWLSLPDVLKALEINEAKIEEKAAFLFYGGLSLLVAITLFGGYHVIQAIV